MDSISTAACSTPFIYLRPSLLPAFLLIISTSFPNTNLQSPLQQNSRERRTIRFSLNFFFMWKGFWISAACKYRNTGSCDGKTRFHPKRSRRSNRQQKKAGNQRLLKLSADQALNVSALGKGKSYTKPQLQFVATQSNPLRKKKVRNLGWNAVPLCTLHPREWSPEWSASPIRYTDARLQRTNWWRLRITNQGIYNAN